MDINRLNKAIESVTYWGINKLGIGTIVAATGFGKTFIGLIAAIKFINKNPQASVRIITMSEAVENHWNSNFVHIEELCKHLEVDMIPTNNINVISINKIINNPPHDKVDLLIIDEIHKITTEDRMKIFNYVFYFEYKYILGLTATYPGSGVVKSVLNKFCPKVYNISEWETIEKSWTADFVEYNLPCYLEPEEQITYDKYSEYMRDIYATYDLGKDFLRSLEGGLKNVYDLIKACTVGCNYRANGINTYKSHYEYRDAISKYKGWSRNMDTSTSIGLQIDTYYAPNNIFKYCDDYMTYVRKRNKLINDAKCKIDTCIEIFKKFPDLKVITFAQSTEFANNLTDATNTQLGIVHTPDHDFAIGDEIITKQLKKPIAIAYHSQLKSRPVINPNTGQYYTTKKGEVKLFGLQTFKKEAIEGIKAGRYRIINTANALDEGVDIVDLQMAIITSGDRSDVRDTQRKGRAKRLDFNNPNGIVRIINLYLADTHEVSKLRDRQTNNRVVWINNVNEII